MKSWRQSQILEVIDQDAVASQAALLERLLAKGITATQATISRDLKELGLVNYVRPGLDRGTPAAGQHLRRALSTLVRSLERVDTLLIVKTDRGQAQGLAEWIDRAQLPEVAGTIGGDDTILLIGRGREAAERIEQTFSAMVKGLEERRA
jgi:transcriptional regulator of arginine metabolism